MSTRDDPPPLSAGQDVSEFSRRSGLELLRFAYLLCGDRHRAEDLLQDVMLAMYRRFPGELPLENPVGYARRALANANISWARRRSSSEVVVELFDDAAERTSSDPAERDLLWQALRQPPVRQRTVLVLRFYEDASDADIAATLSCRLGTVRSLASRALSAMRLDPSLDINAPEGGSR